MAAQMSRYSRADASICASSRPSAGPEPSAVRAAWRCFRRKVSAACGVASSNRSVTPASADTTTTSGPRCAAIWSAAR